MDVVTLGAALKGAKAYTDATIAPLLGGVHYRGSVNYFNNLPSNPAEGDAYTVKYSGTSGTNPDGTEYVWALDSDDNTYKWIGFSPDTYTKSEVDALLSGKQDTVAFEGAYNASTNKAATMSDIKDGKLTGYTKKTGNVAATDKVLDAIGKLETKADTNETNILLLQSGENIVIDSYDTEKYQIKNYYCKKIGSVIFCEFSFKTLQNVTIDYKSAYLGCNAVVAKLQIPNNSIYEPHAVAFDRNNQINVPIEIALNNSGYINITIFTNGTNYTLTTTSYITAQFFAFEK